MKRILISLLAAIMLVSLTMGFVGCGSDYMFWGEDMSEYATWNQAKFNALKVTIAEKYKVDDAAIDKAIKEVLFSERTAVNNGKLETTGAIGYGDEVKLWYSGTVDLGDGKTESVRDAASGNLYNTDPRSFLIGGESIRIPALEEALDGLDVTDYAMETTGVVAADMVYFFTYRSYNIKSDGTETDAGSSDSIVRIPASELDNKFGTGFSSAFASEVVGKTFNDDNRFFDVRVDGNFDTEGVVARRYKLRLLAQTDKELKVEGTFASDGGSYAGKKVTLDVQVFGFIDYRVPELTASVAYDIFEIPESSNDPIADARAEIKKELLADDARLAAIQDALWGEIKKCVTVTNVPESKVEAMEDIFMETLENYYEKGKSEENYADMVEEYGEAAMQNIDLFAAALFHMSGSGKTAEQLVREKAEEWIKEDIAVFTAVQYAGLNLPSDETVETGVDEMLADIMEQSGYSEEELYEMYGGREYFVAAYYRNTMLEMLAQTVTIEYQVAEEK